MEPEDSLNYRLDARHIFEEDDGTTAVVGFADDELHPTSYVLLQKNHAPDLQDQALGMDRLHLEVEDQHRSTYGGISLVQVSPGLIKMHVEQSARNQLRVGDTIEISVQLSHPLLTEVLGALRSIVCADGIPFVESNIAAGEYRR